MHALQFNSVWCRWQVMDDYNKFVPSIANTEAIFISQNCIVRGNVEKGERNYKWICGRHCGCKLFSPDSCGFAVQNVHAEENLVYLNSALFIWQVGISLSATNLVIKFQKLKEEKWLWVLLRGTKKCFYQRKLIKSIRILIIHVRLL